MNSFTFEDATQALPVLMGNVLVHGDEVGSRNGRTKELPFVHITLKNPQRREIQTQGRKVALAAQIAESMWILAGRNDMEFLSHYLPRARDYSDDGETWRGGYGPRIRKWPGRNFSNTHDQLAYVVDLLKKDPLSRRAVIGIYDPVIDTAPGKDIPCNDFIQFMSRLGKLDMHVFIRSNDLMWGFSGINAFEWSALQEIVAGLLGISVGELHFSISSLHLYEPHWDRAQKISESNARQVGKHIGFQLHEDLRTVEKLDALIEEWFLIEEAIRVHGPHTVMGRINTFPEPMLRSWLNVLAYEWSGDESWLDSTSALGVTALLSPYRGLESVEEVSPFVDYVNELHIEKHKAYGDSWKRRGEMLGIMANIARKIDRLGQAETSDETSTDTAIDTLVYLILYRWWLHENTDSTPQPVNGTFQDEDEQVHEMLKMLVSRRGGTTLIVKTDLETLLRRSFDRLEQLVTEKRVDRWEVVDEMINAAYLLAQSLWHKEQNKTRAFTGYPS